MAVSGTRRGAPNSFRRLLGRAVAQDLRAFVVPGPEYLSLTGIDAREIGLRIMTNPRHANVLLLVGPIPERLERAATVVYAQMPRPRAILLIGNTPTVSLPLPDVTVDPDQRAIADGIAELRRRIASHAFDSHPNAFNPAVLQTRAQYTCPMHPEVVADEPGQCLICGMDLVPRETEADRPAMPGTSEMGHQQAAEHSAHEADHQRYTCPMHPDVVSGQPGNCPVCGTNLVPVVDTDDAQAAPHATNNDDHAHMNHDASQRVSKHDAPGGYTCPMHPEIVNDEPGDCPICHMHLVPVDDAPSMSGHAGHDEPDHAQMDHATGNADQSVHPGHGHEPAHQPSNEAGPEPDRHQSHQHEQSGQQMNHGEHGDHGGHEDHGGDGFMSMVAMTKDLPRSRDGLPMEWLEESFGPLFPGLPGGLNLTLTLDGDVVTKAELRREARDRSVAGWVGKPRDLSKLLTGHDRLAPGAYATLAECALGLLDAAGYVQAMERARVISHLAWLASFCTLLGLTWLAAEATKLQIAIVRAPDPGQLSALANWLIPLTHHVEGTTLLTQRLRGVGEFAVSDDSRLVGPVARAAGFSDDARMNDPIYQALDFAPVVENSNDAFARLRVRLAEIRQSVDLMCASERLTGELPAGSTTTISGEVPRGHATLLLKSQPGQVTVVRLETPSSRTAALVNQVASGHEIADALTAIASLDLSPWELAG